MNLSIYSVNTVLLTNAFVAWRKPANRYTMESDKSTEELEHFEVKKKKERICRNRHECLTCGKHISDRRNLVRHLRKIHGIEPIVRKPQLKCSFNDECTFLCATSELLREHLKKAHDFKAEKLVLNFKSRADFEKWKQKEEENTNARYVSYTGTKLRGARKVYYFRCHRSGMVRHENCKSQRKRSKPLKGYTQCGTTCPSSLRVAETPLGNVQVMYYPVHLGHSLDDESILYMKLSSKEKEEIVGKLAQGEPVGKIVSDARKMKGPKLSRINFLQRRDVYNIKKKVNYLEKEADHDAKEIDAWVKHLNTDNLQHNPVVLYSPINESRDYCLILIHFVQKSMYPVVFDESIVYVKAKKGKANVDLNIICVSVVCENGEGYPIAFCITHKIEYITLHTFFKIIYQNFGVIKSQIFVSDNIGHYYLAWKNIMGECDNKFICTFDMESYWEQKLTSLKCPVNKQKEVMAQLKLLLEEPDKDVFEAELSKIVRGWEEDDDVKLFARFFQKFYLKKRFEWATCYRIHSIRKESINNFLEPINTALESVHEESYNSVRNSLNLLLSFVRDVCLVKLLQWDEQMSKEKLQKTIKNHEESMTLRHVKPSSGSEWIVTDEESDYVVRRTGSNCNKKCKLFCEVCDLCTHNYNCVCSDYVTEFNVCKHLHAVGISLKKWNSKNYRDPEIVAFKHSAVAAAKSLALRLETSNLSKEEYKRMASIVSSLENELCHQGAFTKSQVGSEMALKVLKLNSEESRHACNVSTIVCLNNGIASGSDDGKIKIWKPDLDLVSEMEAPGGILSMAVCENILYTCSTDESIQSWDLKAMKNAGKVSTTLTQPQKLFVDRTTNLLWAGDSHGNVAKFEGGKECGKFELVEEIWDMMVTSNPNLVYTARDRDVVVSEIITGNDRTRVMVKSTFQGRSPFCIAGNHLCFLNRDGRNIIVHENSVEKKFPHLKEIVASDMIINAMATAGTDSVYSGGYDSTVKKWDLKSGNSLGSVDMGCCINAFVCPSENKLYVAKSDGFVAKVGV